jgi:hypothetical protein
MIARQPRETARGASEANAIFARDRMEVAVKKLRGPLDVVAADEENQRREAIYQEAAAERDRLAKELAEFYPAISTKPVF